MIQKIRSWYETVNSDNTHTRPQAHQTTRPQTHSATRSQAHSTVRPYSRTSSSATRNRTAYTQRQRARQPEPSASFTEKLMVQATVSLVIFALFMAVCFIDIGPTRSLRESLSGFLAQNFDSNGAMAEIGRWLKGFGAGEEYIDTIFGSEIEKGPETEPVDYSEPDSAPVSLTLPDYITDTGDFSDFIIDEDILKTIQENASGDQWGGR